MMSVTSTRIEYRTACSACSMVHTQPFTLHPGYEIPKPSPPPDWTFLDGAAFCPAHDVRLLVDGETKYAHFAQHDDVPVE